MAVAEPKEVLKFSARSVKCRVCGSNVRNEPGELVLLRTIEAAKELRFDSDESGAPIEIEVAVKDFFKWADRFRVPRYHRGRTVLWDSRILFDFLEDKPWTRRRRG